MNLYLVHFEDQKLNYYAIAENIAEVERHIERKKAPLFAGISIAGSEDKETLQIIGPKARILN